MCFKIVEYYSTSTATGWVQWSIVRRTGIRPLNKIKKFDEKYQLSHTKQEREHFGCLHVDDSVDDDDGVNVLDDWS